MLLLLRLRRVPSDPCFFLVDFDLLSLSVRSQIFVAFINAILTAIPAALLKYNPSESFVDTNSLGVIFAELPKFEEYAGPIWHGVLPGIPVVALMGAIQNDGKPCGVAVAGASSLHLVSASLIWNW